MMKLDLNRIDVLEIENLYKPYEGRRYGYKYKANYLLEKTAYDSTYLKLDIVCTEIAPDSKEVNVEVNAVCDPLGVKEHLRFLAEDTFREGGESMGVALVANSILRIYDVLSKSLNK